MFVDTRYDIQIDETINENPLDNLDLQTFLMIIIIFFNLTHYNNIT